MKAELFNNEVIGGVGNKVLASNELVAATATADLVNSHNNLGASLNLGLEQNFTPVAP